MEQSSRFYSQRTDIESYFGIIKTLDDAIALILACERGLLPRVKRRLNAKERATIRSGSVFVWEEGEADMVRWTDGIAWSASRVVGSILVYQETGEKTAKLASRTEQDYMAKAGGYTKQLFSHTISSGLRMHMVSYHSGSSVDTHTLLQPSLDPRLAGIFKEIDIHRDDIMRGLHPSVRNGPYHDTDFDKMAQQGAWHQSPPSDPICIRPALQGGHSGWLPSISPRDRGPFPETLTYPTRTPADQSVYPVRANTTTSLMPLATPGHTHMPRYPANSAPANLLSSPYNHSAYMSGEGTIPDHERSIRRSSHVSDSDLRRDSTLWTASVTTGETSKTINHKLSSTTFGKTIPGISFVLHELNVARKDPRMY